MGIPSIFKGLVVTLLYFCFSAYFFVAKCDTPRLRVSKLQGTSIQNLVSVKTKPSDTPITIHNLHNDIELDISNETNIKDVTDNNSIDSGISFQNLEKNFESMDSKFPIAQEHKAPYAFKVQVVKAGFESVETLVIIVFGALFAVAVGIFMLIRRKKKNILQKQLKIEKQKFLPKSGPTVETPGEDSNTGMNVILKQKKSQANKLNNVPSIKLLTPNFKGIHPFKLEDNQQTSALQENVFTNIENSPKSVDGEGSHRSVQNTPHELGFNIEFSMIEADSKIKTLRDQ